MVPFYFPQQRYMVHHQEPKKKPTKKKSMKAVIDDDEVGDLYFNSKMLNFEKFSLLHHHVTETPSFQQEPFSARTPTRSMKNKQLKLRLPSLRNIKSPQFPTEP